jgi:hypothetical protein
VFSIVADGGGIVPKENQNDERANWMRNFLYPQTAILAGMLACVSVSRAADGGWRLDWSDEFKRTGSGSGQYLPGSLVSITAKMPPAGKVFDKWLITSGNPTVAGAAGEATTFDMPEGNVSMTATYKDGSNKRQRRP